MELNKKYIIKNNNLDIVINELTEFINIIETFKNKKNNKYNYKIKLFKNNDSFVSIIKLKK